ncbi:MAG TPA: M56 family metallopeptidase, partial [Pirellulales bacterium]|nr:M56 family metallopeptidase [Pirellulales bacterium]
MNARLEALGWWAVDFHLAAAVLLVIAGTAMVCLRQPVHRVALAWATSIGLLLLASLTTLPGWPRTNWWDARGIESGRSIDSLAPVRSQHDSPTAQVATKEAAARLETWPRSPENLSRPGQDAAERPAGRPPAGPAEIAGPSAWRRIPWLSAFGMVFAFSAALSGVWLLLGTAQISRLRWRARPAGPDLVEVLVHVVDGTGNVPSLLLSGDVNQALAMGLVRPVIVLPERLAANEPPARLMAALAHEWAHIRHRDLWLLAVSRLLLPLLALQPFFWWWRRTARQSQEELADAVAAGRGNRLEYAEMLMGWARGAPERVPRGLAGSLTLWERPSQLKRRVARLLTDRLVELRCSRRVRLTVTCATLAAVIVVSLPSLRPAVSAPDTDPQPHDKITLSGRVFVGGQDSADVTVYLREAPSAWSSSDSGMRPSPTRNIAQTKTDAKGRFEFKNVRRPESRSGRDSVFPLDIIALSPGRGLAWKHIAALPTPALELHLPDEQKVAGQLVDRGGRPVADVRVRVREIAGLAEPLHPSLDSARYVDLESSDVSLVAATDTDGRFALRGLPADVRATVVVDDDRYVRRETYVATTDEPQPDLVEWPTSRIAEPRVVPVHLWYSKIRAERAYRVHGRVLFADTGMPVVGAGWNDPPTISPPHGITGAGGGFTLQGLAPGKVPLHITPPAGSHYLGVASTLELSGDDYEIEHTVQLPRGEMVRGRVLDAKNGKGIEGATIWHLQERGPLQNPRPFAQKVRSAADGNFAIAVLPGKGELVVTGPVPGYI